MTHRALIVEDDQQIRESVGDIVASLGHEFELAGSQSAARTLLAEREFSYVLLDLEIPVRDDGGFARVENGQNLLAEMRGSPATAEVPVIVMTAYGADGPELAVRQMKMGATDFVNKPFDGGKLDAAIREALAKRRLNGHYHRHAVVEPKPAGPPRPFQGGPLALHERHATLCGVTILEKNGRGHAWRVLEFLAERNDAGKHRSYSGQELAGRLGKRVAQNAVSQCVRALRKRIAKALREQSNIVCGDQDLIQSGGSGYRLNPWIEVRRCGEPGPPPGSDPDSGAGVTSHDPGDTSGVIPDDPGDTGGVTGVNERQEWILDRLREGVRLRRADVEERFHCSTKTAKRDLAELRQRGLVAFHPKPSPGHYGLAMAADQADLRAISAN